MDSTLISISIFCIVINVISANSEYYHNLLVQESENAEIELTEKNDSPETLNSAVELIETDNMKSPAYTSNINILNNQNDESMSKESIINTGQTVSATSGNELNGKQQRLDELSLKIGENNYYQYPIGQIKMPDLVVDVDSYTKLTANPNTRHNLIFTVKNNMEFLPYYEFDFVATSSAFTILQVHPDLTTPIAFNSSTQVTVDFFVPPRNINDEILGTVEFYAVRLIDRRMMSKTVYIYSPNAYMNEKKSTYPTIDYSFYDNCNGKLRKEICMFSHWSVKVTVTNNDSGLGLKQVTSRPDGIVPERSFTAGTKIPLNFIYSATCCSKSVTITVTDTSDYPYIRTIDVTEWYNLSIGEIAAIVVGTLFILLILIIIIVSCVRCIKKQKQADLSYTHRYGSRPQT